jgi:site-specific DNA-methyltransferase (adenine-specific)
MSSPRQDVLSRAICNLQDAGFETGFSSIYWTYASGFPKATNISKMVDKRLGAEREIIGQRQDILNKQKADFKRGYRKIKDSYDAGAPERDNGFIKVSADITAPATEQAKALDGSYAGFQPKPAVEIILVCMKPLDQKSYVDQALSNRKGVTWLDDCRIPYQNEDDINNVNNTRKAFIDQGGVKFPVDKGWNQNQLNDANRPIEINQKGRFPANLICQDDVLNDGKIYKSGDIKPHTVFNSGQRVLNYRRNAKTITSVSKGDSGSFSRYFDLDRWFETTFPFLIIPKASKSERNMGLIDSYFEPQKVNDGRKTEIDNPFQRGETLRHNLHPTVKPLKLMSYLIMLGSRENDIVLDPFCGSGTTLIAAQMLKRQYVGIEINQEYCKIAASRLEFHSNPLQSKLSLSLIQNVIPNT